MIILVLNNGSTSSRFSLFDAERELLLATGGVENINTESSYFKYRNNIGKKIELQHALLGYEQAFNLMIQYITDKEFGVIKELSQINCVGHRVVHGGEKYTSATFITNEVLKDIDHFSVSAPLHNPKSKFTIELSIDRFPNIKNIAVFDTAFHSTIPKENYLYGIPIELYDNLGIRKYGFHGISYEYVLKRLIDLKKQKTEDVNSVICHMGGGCSMCCIKNGKSFDTTMEYSPLSGMLMASRAGNIDPTIISTITKYYNITCDEAIKFLNEKCGYFGIAGEKDAKKIVEMALENKSEAMLLRKMIDHDFKKNLFSMVSNLDSVDSIVLTGGMMAKNKEQREMLMSNLGVLGVKLDIEKNNLLFDEYGIISKNDSQIPVYVIPTDEEKEISNQCKKLIKGGNY